MKVYKAYRQGKVEGVLLLPDIGALKKYVSLDFKLEEIPPNENNEVRIDLYEPFNIVVTKQDSLIGKRFHDGARVYQVDSWNKDKGAFNCHLVGEKDFVVLYGEKYIRKAMIKL